MDQQTYKRISESIRAKKHGVKIVTYMNLVLTRVVYVAFLVMLAVLAAQKDMRILRILLVTGISFVLISVIRKIIDTPRPYTLYDFDPIMKKSKSGESIPSRHVFSTFVIGMAFLYIDPIFGGLVFVDGVLMCAARVVAWVHFPKDVIVGAVLGILCGVVGFYII